MSQRTSIITALGFSILATSMVACGPGEEDKQDEPIDHATAQQNLTANTSALIKNSIDTVKFIENSKMFERGLDAASSSETCTIVDVTDNDGNVVGSQEECTTNEIDVQIAYDGQDEELNRILTEYVFTQDNIETAEERRIVYLLKGDNVCKDVEGGDKAQCIDYFNKAEIRLNVTSPAPKALTIKVFISAQRHNPVDLQLAADSLYVTARLADAKASAKHIAQSLGEELPELPQTIEGTIYGGVTVKKNGNDLSMTTLLEVKEKVTVADSALGYNFSVDAGVISKINVDPNAQTIQSTTNMGIIKALIPAFATQNGDLVPFHNDGDDAAKKHALEATIGGLNADILFDAKNEVITAKGLGLGDATTTFKVDGNPFLSIDLNPNANRRVDLTVKEAANGDMSLSIAPSLDLTVALATAKLKAMVPDIDAPQWTLDEVLNIKAEGANPVELLIGENLKVLAGKLIFNAKTADITHTVDTNMCLMGDGADESAPTEEPVDQEEAHPFSQISAQSCE